MSITVNVNNVFLAVLQVSCECDLNIKVKIQIGIIMVGIITTLPVRITSKSVVLLAVSHRHMSVCIQHIQGYDH